MDQDNTVISEKSKKPRKKSTRHFISLGEKAKLLSSIDGLIQQGKSFADIARELNLKRQYVRSLYKCRKKVQDFLNISINPRNAKMMRKRGYMTSVMEPILLCWLEDQVSRNLKLTSLQIRLKARRLMSLFSEQLGKPPTCFRAKIHWFESFRRRNCVKVITKETMSGEMELDVVNCDAIEEFAGKLDDIITKGDYKPEQVFAVDEFRFQWRNFPEFKPSNKPRTYPATIMFGTNATGDCKLKPLLIHRFDTPNALCGYKKEKLNVIYRTNRPTTQMTADIFLDWFQNAFIPETREYLQQKNLPFKVILLLDQAPVHPKHLISLHSNVKVIFFPANTSVALQPINRELFRLFKCDFIKRTAIHAVEKMKQWRKGRFEFAEFWQGYLEKFSLRDSIKLIGETWSRLKAKAICALWKPLLFVCHESVPIYDEDVWLAPLKRDVIGFMAFNGLQINYLDPFLEPETLDDAVDYETLTLSHIQAIVEAENPSEQIITSTVYNNNCFENMDNHEIIVENCDTIAKVPNQDFVICGGDNEFSSNSDFEDQCHSEPEIEEVDFDDAFAQAMEIQNDYQVVTSDENSDPMPVYDLSLSSWVTGDKPDSGYVECDQLHCDCIREVIRILANCKCTPCE